MTLGQIISHALAFLLGAIVGPLVVKYFGDKLTDNRRKQERREEIADKWQTLVGRMPDLIAEMREDWIKPQNRLKRSFHIMPRATRNGPIEIELYYTEDKHSDLAHKIMILEEAGLVQWEDEQGLIKKYRVTEEFVQRLLKT